MDVRPTADRVKESLFNIIGTKIIGARVLDMFAGTGNLGLESWSRGAAAVTFVDESRESLRLVQSNIVKCRAEADVQVLKGSAVNIIEHLHHQGLKLILHSAILPIIKAGSESSAEKWNTFKYLKTEAI